MTTIGSKPLEAQRAAAASLPSSIGRPVAVDPAKQRTRRGERPRPEDHDAKPRMNADDLSDEFLLKVVRGFSGTHGTIVDKSV